MRTGRIITLALAVVCLVIAVVYIVAPQAIGGPLAEGSLQPQQGYGLNMPGGAVTAQFTTIPLGVGSLTVPQWSAVVIFLVLGGGFLVLGMGNPKGKAGAQ